MVPAGESRRRIERALSSAYAGGLLSEETFAQRLDEVLSASLIRPRLLVGDLHLRRPTTSLRARLAAKVRDLIARLRDRDRHATLLALDWGGGEQELLLGRHYRCDVVLAHGTVSRRHARLICRDGRWVVHDLSSTNGTYLNGARVGRCELRPGDRLVVGEQRLVID